MFNLNNAFNQWITIASSALAVLVFAACTTTFPHSANNHQQGAGDQKTDEQAIDVLRQESAIVSDEAQHGYAPPPQPAAMVMRMPDTLIHSKMASRARMPYPVFETNRENYHHLEENAVHQVANNPLSTFSIDVDTASYSNIRRILNQGHLPPTDAIRTEEFINYFDYHYSEPEHPDRPFSVNTVVTTSPWSEGRHLLRIGIQGSTKQPQAKGRNLVFLIDVSGSMDSPDKLPLLKKSLGLLSQQLDASDSVSIVVYAGASGLVLPTTAGNKRAEILHALEKLSAGGSTNGGAGIELAYAVAAEAFIPDGINRVILATDGDFNVGTVNHQQLIDLIERKRQTGISLSVLGFGQGNYNDHLTEQLANKGNGNAAYIDNLNEARKVLVEQLDSTFHTIAKDVKIQVEFNPATVSEYRLIGYENRALANEDFNNDKVDAGEIGAGHRVTAVYELTLANSANKYHSELRYQPAQPTKTLASELALIKIRYKQPKENHSLLLTDTVNASDVLSFNDAPTDVKFASAVIGFAQKLRHTKFDNAVDFNWIIDTANNNKGKDEFGYRSEFVQLVRMADALSKGLARTSAMDELMSKGDQLH